jgi:murein L,D-transpeptidase YcbB/YkuD
MRYKTLLFLWATALLLQMAPAWAQAQVQAAWSRTSAGELLSVVEHVSEEGLDPMDYDGAALRRALAGSDDAALQRAASETFVRLATDFTQGHVRNRAAARWYLQGPKLDPAAARRLMGSALASGGVRATLQGLLPRHRQYAALKAALAATPARDKAGSQRLRANLERWRWMPREFGRRYLLVNVPAFTVSLIEDNQVVARHRVIVGKPSTPTPQFSATVTGVIVNPWWEIPASIVRESVGALMARSPAQARQKGYVVSGGHYRQRPGPGNALGQIKLVMPNPYNVYLHDTPSKALFDSEVRAFSHGCIRTQDPFGLFELLLKGTAGWDRSRLDSVVAGGRTTQVSLAQPLPIYVTYLTIAAEEGGELATFSDIYGRDPAIVAGLVDRKAEIAP